MTIALPQLAGAELLTHSQRSCYKTCQRKAYYRYELGVRPKRAATPLRFGSAVHLGLDLLAQGVERDAAIAQAVANYETLPSWCRTDEQVTDWMVERETVSMLLAGYHWYWGGSLGETVIATEQAFELPLRNPETGHPSRTFRRAGKIDKIVRLFDDRLAIREHKTTRDDISPDSDYWQHLDIDEQISEYILAARDLGYPVVTIDYDVIRKPAIEPKLVPVLDSDGKKIVLDAEGNRVRRTNIKRDGNPGVGHGEWIQSGSAEKGWALQQRRETPEEFGIRLLDDIYKRPAFYYQRREIPRLDDDLEEYRHDLWAVGQQYADSRRLGRWFRNTGACKSLGGCEFLAVCRVGINPANPPDGFERVIDVHPELMEV